MQVVREVVETSKRGEGVNPNGGVLCLSRYVYQEIERKREGVLVLSFHHVLVDAWSIQTMLIAFNQCLEDVLAEEEKEKEGKGKENERKDEEDEDDSEEKQKLWKRQHNQQQSQKQQLQQPQQQQQQQQQQIPSKYSYRRYLEWLQDQPTEKAENYWREKLTSQQISNFWGNIGILYLIILSMIFLINIVTKKNRFLFFQDCANSQLF